MIPGALRPQNREEWIPDCADNTHRLRRTCMRNQCTRAVMFTKRIDRTSRSRFAPFAHKPELISEFSAISVQSCSPEVPFEGCHSPTRMKRSFESWRFLTMSKTIASKHR